jgi:hypothetical protein
MSLPRTVAFVFCIFLVVFPKFVFFEEPTVTAVGLMALL